jgi:hypothetical protein
VEIRKKNKTGWNRILDSHIQVYNIPSADNNNNNNKIYRGTYGPAIQQDIHPYIPTEKKNPNPIERFDYI